MSHKTVLLHEAVDGLHLETNHTVVDATFGGGGHANEIVEQLGSNGTFIGIDADETALNNVVLDTAATTYFINDNFKNLGNVLSSLHIEKVDAILADLGWRSTQFTNSGKGFSFNADEPLVMTFGNPDTYPFTAGDMVNEWDEATLSNIFFGYGEERFARRIARQIVRERSQAPIQTSTQLAELVKTAIPRRFHPKRIHPATKVFQALRIAVNEELTVLETFIEQAITSLYPGGRLAIITFHSIEDRTVKHSFRAISAAGRGVVETKKPITPTKEELALNPRARSAKLRIIKKQ